MCCPCHGTSTLQFKKLCACSLMSEDSLWGVRHSCKGRARDSWQLFLAASHMVWRIWPRLACVANQLVDTSYCTRWTTASGIRGDTHAKMDASLLTCTKACHTISMLGCLQRTARAVLLTIWPRLRYRALVRTHLSCCNSHSLLQPRVPPLWFTPLQPYVRPNLLLCSHIWSDCSAWSSHLIS